MQALWLFVRALGFGLFADRVTYGNVISRGLRKPIRRRRRIFALAYSIAGAAGCIAIWGNPILISMAVSVVVAKLFMRRYETRIIVAKHRIRHYFRNKYPSVFKDTQNKTWYF